MTNKDNESVHPVVNWDMGPIPEHKLIVFRPHFISSPDQAIGDAELSRYYALTMSQAKELKSALEKAIQDHDPWLSFYGIFPHSLHTNDPRFSDQLKANGLVV